MNLKLPWLLVALTWAAITSASAHTVWIEPDGSGGLAIRFAEPGEEFERSPGHLDSLSAPLAFTIRTNAPVAVAVTKHADHFRLAGTAAGGVAGAESSFTVRGGRKPLFYARWQPAGAGAGTPLLTLDLVPTGRPGEVRAHFRGRPLGGIQATHRGPDGVESTVTADPDGLLRWDSDKAGQHLLTIARHREPLAGFHHGVAHREISHNCSLVWVQPK